MSKFTDTTAAMSISCLNSKNFGEKNTPSFTYFEHIYNIYIYIYIYIDIWKF